MTFFTLRRFSAALAAAALCGAARGPTIAAQAPDSIVRADLATGRSFPLTMPAAVTRVAVADPEIADVVVVSERDLVINARKAGETDVLVWLSGAPAQHYRVTVRSAPDRMQVVVSVKFAEVRLDALHELGLSSLYRPNGSRVGTGQYGNDRAVDPVTGKATLPLESRFLTLLTDFGTDNFLALLEAQARLGHAKILAEPNIMAANREDASFLAGGEIPIPIAQPTALGQVAALTIQYREFGIKLNFNGEIVSDSLIKLHIKPEVSSLDYTNALVLSGFRIPALRSRRMESTVDVKRDQSLIISGLFDDERERVRTGVPLLMDIPILGQLFSSSSWQRNESELLVVVSVVVVDPMHPRAQDVLKVAPDSTRPALDALKKRIPPAPLPNRQ